MFINSIKIDNAFACRMIFFVVAFYVGLWTIRIPTIKDQIGTDYLGIGYIFASFAFGISINPNPFEDPLFGSITTVQYSISPNSLNIFISSSSVVDRSKLRTSNFI